MQTPEGKDFTLETGTNKVYPVPRRTCHNTEYALMLHGPGRFGVTVIVLERGEKQDFKWDSSLIKKP